MPPFSFILRSPSVNDVAKKSRYATIVAFHVSEEVSTNAFQKFSDFLSMFGIPIPMIAMIPTSSMLLLEVPFFMFRAIQQKEGMALLWVGGVNLRGF